MKHCLQPHMANPFLPLFLGSPLEAVFAWGNRMKLSLLVEPFMVQRLSLASPFLRLPFQGEDSLELSLLTQDEQHMTGPSPTSSRTLRLRHRGSRAVP